MKSQKQPRPKGPKGPRRKAPLTWPERRLSKNNKKHMSPTKKDERLKSLISTGVDLTTFICFRKLPIELRRFVWRFAALDIPGRSVCVQPRFGNTPGLINACREARTEAEFIFKHFRSNQEKLRFQVFLNYDKDILYLNQKFRMGTKRAQSVIEATIQVYPSWLIPVQNLAFNLKEIKFMTSKYRNGKFDLWRMLHHSCPNLKYVLAVLNGPPTHGLECKLRRLSPEHGSKQIFKTALQAWVTLDVFEKSKMTLVAAKKLKLCREVELLEVVDETAMNLFVAKSEES